jgi:hypothetical protein
MVRFARALLALFLLFALAPGFRISTAQPDKLSPDLRQTLASIPGDGKVDVIVRMQDARPKNVLNAGLSKSARVGALYGDLTSLASASQSGALSYLNSAASRQAASDIRPLWIINGIAVSATPEVIEALAARTDVLSITPDRTFSLRDINGPEAPPVTELNRADQARQIADVLRQSLEKPLSGPAAPPAPGASAWGVNKIGADRVWRGLGITGRDVVVGIIDSGVDWNHGALRTNYRGYTGSPAADHLHSWLDATDERSAYPVDISGHGTHVAGTAVGQNGIGVAPGAKWIAARIFNGQDLAKDSWVHTAFEWLLAPGGDPAYAPDVINNSWGDSNGRLFEFLRDLSVLNEAGIFVVFAAGNSGPGDRTVGSPASLPGAYAVGATDNEDDLARFSSRGPSPFNEEQKPEISAPGVRVVSAWPGGVYYELNGTSMAAPHVAGLVALMLSAKPDMKRAEIITAIQTHAVPLGVPLPNMLFGHGRIDAYRTVLSLINTGVINGNVRDGPQAIEGATVTAQDIANGRVITSVTDGSGTFALRALPGLFNISVTPFGYSAANSANRVVSLNEVTPVELSVSQLPSGVVRGSVRDTASGAYISATVRALNTPRTTLSNNSCYPCRYSLDLPAGQYTLEVRATGYRTLYRSVTIGNGQLLDADISLVPTQRIALVDSGAWYYNSERVYYRDALDKLLLNADEIQIKTLPRDIPTAEKLLNYDVVIWSAPFDAPTLISAGNVVETLLRSGRAVLFSGQNIAEFDGGAPYMRELVHARIVADYTSAERVIGSTGGVFAGIDASLAGGEGADNQLTPDVIRVSDTDLADLVFSYASTIITPTGAAVATSPCSESRAIFTAFGLEGLASAQQRSEVISRALASFAAPKPQFGLDVQTRNAFRTQAAIGDAGSTVSQTIRIRNTGAGGTAQTYQITASGNRWQAGLSSQQITLAPCQSALVNANISIPIDAARGASDTVRLSVDAVGRPELSASLVLTSKTPDYVLLVDDDRWVDSGDTLINALAAGSVAADRWDADNEAIAPSPAPLSTLRRYPIVIWSTGDDWYRPVSAAEAATMQAYIDGGGRVLLSSPSGLSYLGNTPLFSQGFGVAAFDLNDVTSSTVGVNGSTLGDGIPGGSLMPFPYLINATHSIQPGDNAQVFLRNERWQPVGLLNSAAGQRSAYVGIPFDALPKPSRSALLNKLTGWLSPVGSSILSGSARSANPGETVTLALDLRADTVLPIAGEAATVSWSFSNGLSAGAGAAGERVVLTAGGSRVINAGATVNTGVATGTLLTATATIRLEKMGLTFQRDWQITAGGPRLSAELAGGANGMRWGSSLPMTATIVNTGGGSDNITARIVLPAGMSAQRVTPSSGAVQVDGNSLIFGGALAPGERVTISFVAVLPTFNGARPNILQPTLLVYDRAGNHITASAAIRPFTFRTRFAIMAKNAVLIP